jgi:hypothetical protein
VAAKSIAVDEWDAVSSAVRADRLSGRTGYAMAGSSTGRDTVVIVASHRDSDDVEQLRDQLPAPVRACTVHEWVDVAVWLPSAEEWAAYIAEMKRTFAELRIDLAELWEAEAREIPHRFTQQQAGLILWRLKHAFAHACAVVLLMGRGVLAASAAWREDLALLLGAAAQQETVILPVLMDPASDADFLLDRFAPVHDPARPLSVLAPEEREQIWTQVAAAVESALGQSRADAKLTAVTTMGPRKPGALRLTLRGQIGGVLGLAWSPDGRRIAAACEDARVYLWDAETGERALTYEGHWGEVNAVAWSPDSTRLASVAEDAQVWEAATGRRLVTYTGHTGQEALSVAWSPDGRRIATGSADKTVHVWDATTGERRLTYTGHADQVNAVAWSPDGGRIVSGAGDAWNGNVRDPTAQVWQAETGEHLLTYPGYLNPVRVVARWRADRLGESLAAGVGCDDWSVPVRLQGPHT